MSTIDAGAATDGRSINSDANPALRLVCRIDIDEGLDGSIDRIDNRVYLGTLLRSIRRDNDVDGDIDYSIVYTYNANDKLTILTIDSNGDGEINRRDTFTYVDGRLGRRNFDTNNDRVDDQLWDYIWDIPNERVQTVEKDTNLAVDGLETVETYSYNPEGLLNRIVRNNASTEGPVNWIELRSYDSRGLLTLFERDTNADGSINYRFTQDRDPADGAILKLNLDSNGDGELEEVRDYIYDC